MEIRKSIYVGAPMERVWQSAFATQDGLRGWLNPNIEYEPRLGGRHRQQTSGVEIVGEVVAFDPPHRLVITWNQIPPGYPEPTTVTFELTEEGTGTRIHVTHAGFERLPASLQDGHFEGYRDGWHHAHPTLEALKAFVEGGPASGPVVTSFCALRENGPETMEIRCGIRVDAPPERVWRQVATEDGLRRWWYASTRFEPRVGGKVAFTGEYRGAPFAVGGEVVEYVPEERLAFTWDDPRRPWPAPTRLSIVLQPERGGTRVNLVHHGFERMPRDVAERLFLGFREGWDGASLVKLKASLEQAAD